MPKQTIKGYRPDLAGLPVNQPQEYIGGKILPAVPVLTKSGTVYYKTVTADSEAETRSSLKDAPAGVLVADSNTTYTCVEYIKRYLVAESEVDQMGGIEKADEVGAKAAKRSVMRALESAVANALYTGTPNAVGNSIIDTIIAGADSVKRYAGKLAFVCSTTVYRWLIQQEEIKGLLLRTFDGGLTAEQVLSLSPDAFKAMLRGLFMFDEVLIGDDAHWEIEEKSGYAAVVKLPPNDDVYAYKSEPVLGCTFTYMPQDGSQFEIYSFFDDTNRCNTYDATVWAAIKVLNNGAKYLISGLESGT